MQEPLPIPPDTASLYDEAACGLLLTAHDGTIVRVNATFLAWTGYAAHELVGERKLQDLLTMGGRIFHQTHWAPLLHLQGSVAEVKLELSHRDGRPMPMVMNAVRREHGGGTWHQVAVFSAADRNQYERELLAARKHAEELLAQAQQSQRELAATQQQLQRERALAEDRALFAEQMIGIVSHDLRNPLSAIQMSTHLLGRGELTSLQMRVLERLSSATGRATRLIADLLDFTQARMGGGLKIARRPLDLHAVASEAVEELQLAYPGRRLQHRAEGEGTVVADGDRLAQLIGNLVSNAMVYGDPMRPVTVTSRVEDDRAQLVVHNHGPVIPEGVRARLFEPMARGHEPTASGRSVGLGGDVPLEAMRDLLSS
jgi:sigma-B regulation protein RsbU (phosphoserine phosphatase)